MSMQAQARRVKLNMKRRANMTDAQSKRRARVKQSKR